jgi:putative FmdB family regulatory protein
MPTYEYECHKCHHHFDAFQTMSSAVYTTCPKELCQMKKWGKGKVKRLIGAGAGLLFKGSGFYITDYRSEGYKNAAKSDTSLGSSTTPPAEKKSPATNDFKSAPSDKSSVEKKTPPAKTEKQKKKS